MADQEENYQNDVDDFVGTVAGMGSLKDDEVIFIKTELISMISLVDKNAYNRAINDVRTDLDKHTYIDQDGFQ